MDTVSMEKVSMEKVSMNKVNMEKTLKFADIGRTPNVVHVTFQLADIGAGLSLLNRFTFFTCNPSV